jgi:hypothetical protein
LQGLTEVGSGIQETVNVCMTGVDEEVSHHDAEEICCGHGGSHAALNLQTSNFRKQLPPACQHALACVM